MKSEQRSGSESERSSRLKEQGPPMTSAGPLLAFRLRKQTVFYVGQKVVCVKDRRYPGGYPYVPKLPKQGCVYTIREIVPCRAQGYDEDGMRLVEIINPVRIHSFPLGRRKSELSFRLSRFRPVHTTNIDVFLKMLEPQDRAADAAYQFILHEP